LTSALTTALDPLGSAVSKVKRHVLPLFLIMFIANYIDRVNIGFVNTHMKTDLGIGAAAYGLGSGLFFIGYALFEVPSNVLMQKYGARAWLTRIMGTWGVVAAAMAFVSNETSFYVLRFLLGVAEAGFFPGVVFYFTQWLPQNAARLWRFFSRARPSLRWCRDRSQVACCPFADSVCTAGNGCS